METPTVEVSDIVSKVQPVPEIGNFASVSIYFRLSLTRSILPSKHLSNSFAINLCHLHLEWSVVVTPFLYNNVRSKSDISTIQSSRIKMDVAYLLILKRSRKSTLFPNFLDVYDTNVWTWECNSVMRGNRNMLSMYSVYVVLFVIYNSSLHVVLVFPSAMFCTIYPTVLLFTKSTLAALTVWESFVQRQACFCQTNLKWCWKPATLQQSLSQFWSCTQSYLTPLMQLCFIIPFSMNKCGLLPVSVHQP